MHGPLVVALVGSLIFGVWLVFEVWIRRGEVREIPFHQREERSGYEDTFWRVRVQIPASHSVEEKWVWVSRKQYAELEGQSSIPVHVRHVGERTVLRGVNHGGRVWLIGFLAFYFAFNLIIQVFNL